MPITGSDGFSLTVPKERVRSNRLLLIESDGQRILLTRVEGELCAFDALCPPLDPSGGNLARGDLVNGEIECPVHNWRFNIRTGASVYPEEESLRLRHYQVQEENGAVKIKLP